MEIPNQIQDQNGVNWGSDSLNGLAAAGVDAASAVMQSGDIGKAFTTAGNQMSNFTSNYLYNISTALFIIANYRKRISCCLSYLLNKNSKYLVINNN